jgi:hypothetical protein
MARFSFLQPGTNRILCKARGFVYIRFEVRVDGSCTDLLTALSRTSLLRIRKVSGSDLGLEPG